MYKQREKDAVVPGGNRPGIGPFSGSPENQGSGYIRGWQNCLTEEPAEGRS